MDHTGKLTTAAKIKPGQEKMKDLMLAQDARVSAERERIAANMKNENKKDFVSSLKEKFEQQNDENLSDCVIYVSRSVHRKSESGDLCVPDRLVMSGCGIGFVGRIGELSNSLSNVTELDLSYNCFNDWIQIFTLLDHMPRVSFLDLTGNIVGELDENWFKNRFSLDENWLKSRFSVVSTDESCTRASYPNLSVLVLNWTNVSILSVLQLLHILPRMKELHLSHNQYRSIDLPNSSPSPGPSGSHPSVECLYLNGNLLSDWSQIEKLDELFPNLTQLIVMENPISSVTPTAEHPISGLKPTTENPLNGMKSTTENLIGGMTLIAENPLNSMKPMTEGGGCCATVSSDSSNRTLNDKIVCDNNVGTVCEQNLDTGSSGKELVCERVSQELDNVNNDENISTFNSDISDQSNEAIQKCEVSNIQSSETIQKPEESASQSNEAIQKPEESASQSECIADPEQSFIGSHESRTRIRFARLERLCLTRTLLNRAEDLENLSALPSLTDLKLISIPFLQDLDEELRRQLMISLLPHVTVLNGSAVSPSERDTAERTFLRHYFFSTTKPASYERLVTLHGELEPLQDIDLSVSDFVCVTLKYEGRSMLYKVSVHHTCSEVKLNIAQVLNLPANQIRMFHGSHYTDFVPNEMRFPKRKILNYRIEEGDEIICDLKRITKTSPAKVLTKNKRS